MIRVLLIFRLILRLKEEQKPTPCPPLVWIEVSDDRVTDSLLPVSDRML